MTRSSARASGAALAALWVVLLATGSARAATDDAPLETSWGPVGDERLASGVLGCWDPDSWVWQAPRAERVAVAVTDLAVCEIGRDDCERRPETVPAPDPTASLYEAATLTCALKRAHHDQQEGAEPFDAKSCLESEMTLWTVDDVAPPRPARPFDAPACSEQDPECHSMPPLPDLARYVSHSPSAASPPAPPQVQTTAAPGWSAAVEGSPRAGVRRRVDRPPNG